MALRSRGPAAALSCALVQLLLFLLYGATAAAAGLDLATAVARLAAMPAVPALLLLAHLLLTALGTALLCARAERRARPRRPDDAAFDALDHLRRCGAI